MSIVDYLKDAAKLALELKKMDLYQHLLEAQAEVVELKTETLNLRSQVTNLTEKLSIKESLVFENGVYWIKADVMTADRSDTPVCPRCWDSDGKVLRLKVQTFGESADVYCQQCKSSFNLKKAPEPKTTVAHRRWHRP